ncbi:transcription termination/antitermination NusG family protein [Pelosinus fermentans]|nr:transcription termination/antitermination NusG family protein [Pelosinus fermentans]
MIVIEWYVLRTVCGKEDAALTMLRKLFPEVELIYPKRRISWRKQGAVIGLVRPLFDGYLFISCPREKIRGFDQLLRIRKLNIAWLVYSGEALVPILNEEKELIQRLMGSDGIVEVSTVVKHDEQLQILNGPLVGLEHIVKKVSHRNRRITVEVSMLDEKRKIELEGILI